MTSPTARKSWPAPCPQNAPPHGDRQGQAWVKEQQARTLEQVAYTDLYRLIDVLRTFVNYWCQRAEQCIVG